MNADDEKLTDAERAVNLLTERIIGCAFKVANTLGAGFLERVYENALVHELRRVAFKVEQQKGIVVTYDGVVVGEYFADLIVAGLVLVELKAARAIDEVHVAQCLNYLKATGMRVCLLFNFGSPKLGIKRIML